MREYLQLLFDIIYYNSNFITYLNENYLSYFVWVGVYRDRDRDSRSRYVSVSALSRSRCVSVSVSVCLGSRRYYLCVCLVFVLHFYKHVSIFSTHLTKKSWFSLIIWPFKGNFENLTSSASRPFNQRDRTKSTMREKSKLEDRDGPRPRLSRPRVSVHPYVWEIEICNLILSTRIVFTLRLISL